MEFKNKKILITGGAGFIGANFVYKFLELGYSVTTLERKSTNLWRLKKVLSNIKIYSPDLTDYKKTEACIKKIKPNIVLHFAAYGAYQRFQQDIATTIDVNVKGTINLLHACQKVGIECFINTGSSSEYGIKNAPMKETDVLEPDNLYAITKSAVTLYGQMMARKFNFPIATIRPFAVYGYFEEPGRLIPDIIKAYLHHVPPKLSSPHSVRDFIFIEDLIDGYMAVIKNIKKIKGEVFNLGSGKQDPVHTVVTIIKELNDSAIKPHYGSLKKAQTEPSMWVADISKAQTLLKWKPAHTLEQGLKKDIEWFKRNLAFYE
ncbi:MAG: SDR family NAD(P)-dependent oxidoreductase [Candidatus Staskawiczbacteria bacterium]|nr:SDR family NAD(P)-dependent oxidoreductase [Candidatus Staskawiczbacteria bacterium]